MTTTTHLFAIPTSGTGDTAFAASDYTRVDAVSAAGGVVAEEPAADGAVGRRTAAATFEQLDVGSFSGSSFATAGSRDGQSISLSQTSGSGAVSHLVTNGVVVADSDEGPDVALSVSSATLIANAWSSSHSGAHSRTEGSGDGEYSASRQGSSTSGQTRSFGDTRVIEADGDELAFTNVSTVSVGKAGSSSNFTSRQSVDGGAVKVSGHSRNRAGSVNSSTGDVTTDAGETESVFSVRSSSTASARLETEVEEQTHNGAASIKSHVSRSQESSAHVSSSGAVKTDAEGEEELSFSGDTSTRGSTELDSQQTETTRDAFGQPHATTTTGRVNASSTSTAGWSAEGRGGEPEVSVNSSSSSESGAFAFDGSESYGWFFPDGFGVSSSEWSLTGGPNKPTTATEASATTSVKLNPDSVNVYRREDYLTQESKHGGGGGEGAEDDYTHSTTQTWDGTGVKTFFSDGRTITTTHTGKVTEDFKSAGGQAGDRQELKLSHQIDWRKVESESTEPFSLYIWANKDVPTVPAGNEQYLDVEYTNSTIETRTERGNYTSSHTIGIFGGAWDGKMEANSLDKSTRTDRQEYSWDYSPPDLVYEEQPGPEDDGFRQESNTGKKTREMVSRTSKRVTESGAYWDLPLLGRLTLGGAKTVVETTAGEESSESGKEDLLEVGYYDSEGAPQHVADVITEWGSNISDTTTTTATTHTIYGPGFGVDITTTKTSGGPAPSGKVTETYNSRIITEDQDTVVNPQIEPIPPAEPVERGPAAGPITGEGGGTIDVTALASAALGTIAIADVGTAGNAALGALASANGATAIGLPLLAVAGGVATDTSGQFFSDNNGDGWADSWWRRQLQYFFWGKLQNGLLGELDPNQVTAGDVPRWNGRPTNEAFGEATQKATTLLWNTARDTVLELATLGAGAWLSRFDDVNTLRKAAKSKKGEFPTPILAKLRKLKPFTKENFRENLTILTKVAPKNAHAHHVFPQKFAKQFADRGINVNNPAFGAWWKKSAHQRNSQPYEDLWGIFLSDNPSKREILDYGRELAGGFGFDVIF